MDESIDTLKTDIICTKSRIGIIGAGNMGIQLAECFIEHQFNVTLKTRFIASKDGIISKVKKHLSKRYGGG